MFGTKNKGYSLTMPLLFIAAALVIESLNQDANLWALGTQQNVHLTATTPVNY